MTTLDRKLLRDLWAMKGQALAICLVMASGVALFVMSLTTLHSLRQALADYYEQQRFGQVFTRFKRAPRLLAARVGEIPGVARVQARVVVNVNLDLPGVAEPLTGRLVSIPEHGPAGLNDLHLRQGRWVEPGRRGEVLVHEAFAEAHGLRPGGRLSAVINGRLQPLLVVGVALSPEYVYAIREGDFMPDNRRFGVFWMGETDLAAAFDMREAFNDLSLRLMPGASEPEVLTRLDRLTTPYGGLGAHGRDEQVSHRFISGELTQLRGMALITPAIFLAVTAFLLHVVLSRLIRTQREQIAALKAFGYTRREVGWHYGKLVGLLVLAGVVLGVAVGARLGWGVTQMYGQFFRFPSFDYRLTPTVPLLALAVTGGAALLGAAGAVRGAMRLPPAEAMRPEPPAHYRPTLLERLGLQRLFSPAVRMILRHLERQWLKTALSCLGLALAVAVLILGNCIEDSVRHVIDTTFFASQRQDVTVVFNEPASAEALHELARLPGVRLAEPFRSVPVRLRFGHRQRRLAVMGLPHGGELYRLLDARQRRVPIPPEGLVVSAKLLELLDCRRGDTVELEVLEGERPLRLAPIVATIDDFTEPAAYMRLDALHRLMREGGALSGAHLAVDPRQLAPLYRTLKQMPRVAGVNGKRSVLASFEKILAENLLRMKLFNVLFASILAVGVVYNNARIALAERRRDLATLRVMGFTRGEISVILLGELGVLTLLAIPPGMLIGRIFAAVLTVALETETQRFPLLVQSGTYAFAALVTLLAALASGLIVRRQLDRLDLTAVLKAQE